MSSFDPFEARMQFLSQLRKLNASQQSIHKLSGFAIKYGSRCGEDLWECIAEQCGKGSLNTRINILYFLDSLLEASLALGPTEAPYLEYVTRNLQAVVDGVVPDTNEGILNLKSARQILESWRLRRIIDPAVVGEVLKSLEGRKHGSNSPKKRNHEQAFSKSEIVRRMEEDRERHKRLRERIWILPIPSLLPRKPLSNPSPSTASPFTPASPHPGKPDTTSDSAATAMPPPPVPSGEKPVGQGNPLDVEFEQTWEGASEPDEEELEKMRE
ncbi:hypothetical protein IAT38_002229 [Cryptococcus sp. DSM 104549]